MSVYLCGVSTCQDILFLPQSYAEGRIVYSFCTVVANTQEIPFIFLDGTQGTFPKAVNSNFLCFYLIIVKL